MTNHMHDLAQGCVMRAALERIAKQQLVEERLVEGGDYEYGYEQIVKLARAALAAQPPAAPVETESEIELVCAEAYQVVGSMLSDLGQFDTDRGQKILDNLSQARMVHRDVLPWPSFETPHPGSSAATGDARGLALNANAMAKLEAKKGNTKTAEFLRGIATYLNTLNEPQAVQVTEKPRPDDCPWPVDCMWRHVPTVPEIGLHLCSRFGCPHTTSAASTLSRPQSK